MCYVGTQCIEHEHATPLTRFKHLSIVNQLDVRSLGAYKDGDKWGNYGYYLTSETYNPDYKYP